MGFLDRINRMDRIGVRGASNGRGGSPLPPARGWPWRSGDRGEGKVINRVENVENAEAGVKGHFRATAHIPPCPQNKNMIYYLSFVWLAGVAQWQSVGLPSR